MDWESFTVHFLQTVTKTHPSSPCRCRRGSGASWMDEDVGWQHTAFWSYLKTRLLDFLGGGFKDFFQFSLLLGKMIQIWQAYFSNGLVQPPTSFSLPSFRSLESNRSKHCTSKERWTMWWFKEDQELVLFFWEGNGKTKPLWPMLFYRLWGWPFANEIYVVFVESIPTSFAWFSPVNLEEEISSLKCWSLTKDLKRLLISTIRTLPVDGRQLLSRAGWSFFFHPGT